jgi:hypothetical protein
MLPVFNLTTTKYTNSVILTTNNELDTRIAKQIIEYHERIKYKIVITDLPDYNDLTENIYNNLTIIRRLNSYKLCERQTPILLTFDNVDLNMLEDQDITYLYLNGRFHNTMTITTLPTIDCIPSMLYLTTDFVFLKGTIDDKFIQHIYDFFVSPITSLETFTAYMNAYNDISASIVIDTKGRVIYAMPI